MSQLKEIANSQKTVSTSKLIPLLEALDKERIRLGSKIKSQTDSINDLNKRYQKLQHRLRDFHELQVKYSALKTNHTLMIEKNKRRAIEIGKFNEVL
jgi:uncharacterized protein involved in exopolysaccharide biosynthesis